MDVSDIFYFFVCLGEGEGECEALGGGGAIFYGKSQEGVSRVGGGGGEGPGGCLWGIWGGGGGLNIFFFGAEMSTEDGFWNPDDHT